MAFFDLPLDQLKKYKSPDPEPPDFDAFWKGTLEATRKAPLKVEWAPLDAGFKFVEAFDVTFSGYEGQPVKGWFLLPRERKGKVPCLVEFIGYGGGRGFVQDWLLWPNLGCAVFVMDTRGQGSGWSQGGTSDPEPPNAGPQGPGFMTRGLASKETYYYRRVFSDAVRAVDAALSHEAVDPARLGVAGGSQGGGISIAAAGLHQGVKLVLPDVPFLCHYRRALEITTAFPYQEITNFLTVHRGSADAVLKTLSYFDGVNFARRSKAEALYSVALMDGVCPPSTIFAAYNNHAGPKDIKVYTYNQHEGGGPFQTAEKMKFLRGQWSL